jgi:hypothetical protein
VQIINNPDADGFLDIGEILEAAEEDNLYLAVLLLNSASTLSASCPFAASAFQVIASSSQSSI